MLSEQDNSFIGDPEFNFRRPELVSFLAYWNVKRGARKFPSRPDIVPREIPQLLPWIHMHDVADDNEYRIRLIGTKLAETFGPGDFRGQSITALPKLVYERVLQGITWVLEARAPIRTWAARAALPGQDFQGIESCFAPLSSNDKDIDMVVAISILETRK